MSAPASPVDSSSAETPPEIPSSPPAQQEQVEEAAKEDVESSEPLPPPAPSSSSKGRPATVEDAQDSDNEDAPAPESASAPPKTAEEVEDAISRAIAAAEAGAGGEGQAQPPSSSSSSQPAQPPHAWQAVWSPAQNMYYFYNGLTMETTWTNPLVDPKPPPSQPSPTPNTGRRGGGESPVWDPSATTLPGQSSSSSYPPQRQQPSSSSTPFSYGSASSTSQHHQPPSTSSYGGIDPGLSHLLPPSYNPLNPNASYTSTARFNQRTGRFDSDPNHTPDHLSEYNRAKRQNGAFFDQEAWEREREEEHERQRAEEEGGGKRKKLSKADVNRFKEKKEGESRASLWTRRARRVSIADHLPRPSSFRFPSAKKTQRNSWLRS
ncbi:hypothetical protein BDY24DRAFT_252615 [Mrakia frigida]|uniref:WW domain-containing protein n=1 Tax=Mrakia frigida TaxID=29902 RepID=UPI003FCC04C1